MKILVVEDDDDFVDEIRDTILESVPLAVIDVSSNRDDALSNIRREFYDLILLDLNIPTIDGALDGAPAHGHSVLADARLQAPGTPVFVLTGSSAEEFIPSIAALATQEDVWGAGQKMQMLSFHPKHKLDRFPEQFAIYAKAYMALRDVELHKGTLRLSIEQERLIRIFARTVGGAKCAVKNIDGGLSETKVFRLTVSDSHGMVVHHAVCKIGEGTHIDDEGTRYDQFVARLGPNATPRKLATLRHGAKSSSGIFYGLADGFDTNMFGVAVDGIPEPRATLRALEEITQGWRKGVEERKRIADVRRVLLTNAQFDALRPSVPLSWIEEFERQEIQTKWCCIHGDMHGLNVLVDSKGTPILIDYGDITEGPASLDPVTLELSLLFHPRGPLRESLWPSRDQALIWSDVDQYVNGSTCPEFIKECREWANRSAAGQREIAAVAYAFLMRQLKYSDVNRDRALSLLAGVKVMYDAT